MFIFYFLLHIFPNQILQMYWQPKVKDQINVHYDFDSQMSVRSASYGAGAVVH